MSIDFPTDPAPIDGDEYSFAGKTWVFVAAVPAWQPKAQTEYPPEAHTHPLADIEVPEEAAEGDVPTLVDGVWVSATPPVAPPLTILGGDPNTAQSVTIEPLSGVFTTDGTTPITFPRLQFEGDESGRPAFSDNGDTRLFYDSGEPGWLLDYEAGAALWISPDADVTPDLADWTDSAQATATGFPVITLHPPVQGTAHGQMLFVRNTQSWFRWNAIYERWELSQDGPAIVLLTGGSLTLQGPNGDFVRGARKTYHITPTGVDRALDISASIAVPSDSALVFPKTLNQDELYIVQLTHSGSFWMLTSIVGGYASPP